ncbi:MAG: lipoyl synthase [Deltaproteobacteria bacterium]|nr:lipoyl synthase [Deltaproteobacteria bacterium]
MAAVGPQQALEVLDWGLLDYGEALERQEALVGERVAGTSPDRLVLVEHPPVVTVGRSGDTHDLLLSQEQLVRRGVAVHFVSRGGQATYHGPGQMVAYPIIRLGKRDLHLYLDTLLEAAAEVLRIFGIEPQFKERRPGLWAGSGKIASVGIAVRRWVTYHGLAFNVNTDVDPFGLIVPCGSPGQPITSMARVLGRPVDMERVKEHFVGAFRKAFGYREHSAPECQTGKHPEWLVRRAPDTAAMGRMERRLGEMRLATVCQSAECPNQGECFARGTATFMILGDRCTRRCRFCAVTKAVPEIPDPDEPARVARAAFEMRLRHVVVTSVTRDDLPDGGAGQFVSTIRRIRASCPEATVETLIPDFQGSVAALETVVAAWPDMLNHNVETVARLYPVVRPRADYRRSLSILEYASTRGLKVKSGLMLGLGETDGELLETLVDLKRAGCRYLTLGQYLAPSGEHIPVARYVSPEAFDRWAEAARNMGFLGVAAGPLVRSSYRAENMMDLSPKRKGENRYGQEEIHCGAGNRH